MDDERLSRDVNGEPESGVDRPAQAPSPAEELASEPPRTGESAVVPDTGGGEAAPRPRRALWIVAVVVALFAIAAVGAAGAVYLRNQADKAERDAALTVADEHWAAATSALKSAHTSNSRLGDVTSADAEQSLGQSIETLEQAVATAESEFDEAERAIRRIEDSPGRQKYLDSIEAGREAARELQDASNSLQGKAELLALVDGASDQGLRVLELLGEAVDNANREKWSAALRSADRARAEADSGLRRLARIEALEKKLKTRRAGVDQARRELQVLREAAVISRRTSEDGRAGRFSAYNRGVNRYNDVLDKLKTLSMPRLFQGPRVYLEGPLTSIELSVGMMQRAEREHAAAREALVIESR